MKERFYSKYFSECISGCTFFFIFVAGNLTQHHQEIFHKNPLFTGMKLPSVKKCESFERKFPKISRDLMDLIVVILFLFTLTFVLKCTSCCLKRWASVKDIRLLVLSKLLELVGIKGVIVPWWKNFYISLYFVLLYSVLKKSWNETYSYKKLYFTSEFARN